jgi:hypothetical protein
MADCGSQAPVPLCTGAPHLSQRSDTTKQPSMCGRACSARMRTREWAHLRIGRHAGQLRHQRLQHSRAGRPSMLAYQRGQTARARARHSHCNGGACFLKALRASLILLGQARAGPRRARARLLMTARCCTGRPPASSASARSTSLRFSATCRAA